MGTASAEFVVSNQLGLHVRAAAMVVRTVTPFQSTITIRTDSGSADARSVLDLLTLSANKGTKVTVAAEGPDADAAVAALGDLIMRNFAE
ncbi:MAG TPA: HPr family phosphocarrier protein [Candidatus Limnocylindrales bacterium]|nr:HPr family phosphocarrier protein [Candidatus Limnocylindrales bacterium]